VDCRLKNPQSNDAPGQATDPLSAGRQATDLHRQGKPSVSLCKITAGFQKRSGHGNRVAHALGVFSARAHPGFRQAWGRVECRPRFYGRKIVNRPAEPPVRQPSYTLVQFFVAPATKFCWAPWPRAQRCASVCQCGSAPSAAPSPPRERWFNGPLTHPEGEVSSGASAGAGNARGLLCRRGAGALSNMRCNTAAPGQCRKIPNGWRLPSARARVDCIRQKIKPVAAPPQRAAAAARGGAADVSAIFQPNSYDFWFGAGKMTGFFGIGDSSIPQ